MGSTRRHLLVCALLVAGLFGCSPSMTLDAPEIDITEKNLAFPGVSTSVPGAPSATAVFKVQTGKLGAAANPDSSAYDRIQRMEITRIVVQARRGITDFLFLQGLKITATNYDPNRQTGEGKPKLTILDCTAGSPSCPQLGQGVGPTLSFPLEPPADLVPLWANTNLYLSITATGTVPPIDWAVDVTFALSVRWSI